MSARYFCGTEGRRAEVRRRPAFNGIDFVEVSADQLRLFIHFLRDQPAVATLARENIAIDGGVRVRGIRATGVTVANEVATVTLDRFGDFSAYTLRLRKSETENAPPPDIDPRLASVEFSFKIDCPTDFDCADPCDCPLHADERIDIDYLARDYESFRRVMLDRMALTLPEWSERNPADAGVALVEMLAYVADSLSYQQDAVATEAYLGTARRRTSVRRHARLVDYTVDDGANARAWVCFTVKAPIAGTLLPRGTTLVTKLDAAPAAIATGDFHPDLAEAAGALVFEIVDAAAPAMRREHNELTFYTWSSTACCLPRGSTKATLDGAHATLLPGMVLVLREKRGPESGSELDADPSRAHAVRLTKADTAIDPVTGAPITEIEWHDEDRLPFPLCVSAELPAGFVSDVGVAHANVVLADHGRTLPPEELTVVPAPNQALARAPRGSAGCGTIEREPAPLRYQPLLRSGPVTRSARRRIPGDPEAQPFDPGASASSAMRWSPADVLPALSLEDADGLMWQPRRDLLGSAENARELVVESEEDGRATLRFGDDRQGRRPDEGTTLIATYRAGNGTRGNVGAHAIRHVVVSQPVAARIEAVVNYTPGIGGTDPEPLTDVRLNAPVAFRKQERAVTPADYEEVATRHPEVQRAAATFRWTGSWYTVYVTVDRTGGLPIDREFRRVMLRHIDRYRMAGYDLEIEAPRFVPLELAIQVCATPDAFPAVVERELLEAFGSRTRPDGRLGFFHPNRFTFGQPVHLSAIVAAAHDVPGVQSVEVTTFRRRGDAGGLALTAGTLFIDRLEVARLDNDPNFPENGTLSFRVGGGR